MVRDLRGVVAISAGMNFSLALKSDGTVWGWGSNSQGQLGDRTFTNRMTPVQVHELEDMVAIATGWRHSVAVKSDGTLWVWGYNGQGQLGEAMVADRLFVPVKMPGFSGAKAVSAGMEHSLVMKSDGTVWAWGRSAAGQIGDGSISYFSTPVQAGVVRETPGE